MSTPIDPLRCVTAAEAEAAWQRTLELEEKLREETERLGPWVVVDGHWVRVAEMERQHEHTD